MMHPARHARFRTNVCASTTGMQEQTPIAEKWLTSVGDNEVKRQSMLSHVWSEEVLSYTSEGGKL